MLSIPLQPAFRTAGTNSDVTLPGPARLVDGIQGLFARSTELDEPTGAGMLFSISVWP